MKLKPKDQKMFLDYQKELDEKKIYQEEEIETLILNAKQNSYEALRTLYESQLKYALEIASTYENETLSILDFIHSANEGLEVAVTSLDYSDYNSFKLKVETCIKESISLMLSFLES